MIQFEFMKNCPGTIQRMDWMSGKAAEIAVMRDDEGLNREAVVGMGRRQLFKYTQDLKLAEFDTRLNVKSEGEE